MVARLTGTHRASTPRPSLSRWVDPVLVATVTLLGVGITALVNPRFYFYDDTQSGSAGNFYHLGTRLRAGDFSVLDLQIWSSGNILLEGQWGVFNPVMLALALLATVMPNLGLFLTTVKAGFLVAAALGAHRLSLLLHAGRRNAFGIAIITPLTGFTTYMDAASWATGLFAWTFFLWMWIALLQLRRGRWGFWPAAGFLFLIVSIGYVHGTLMSLLLLISYLAVDLARSRWRAATSMTVVIAATVGMALLVFLPAALTSSVTRRHGFQIEDSGVWSPDLSDLAALVTITPGVEIAYWWGATPAAPVFYVGWLIPLLVPGLIDRLRNGLMSWPIAVFAVGVVAFAIGPSEIGPLRWPIRVLPYFAVALLMFLAYGSRDEQWDLLRRRTSGMNLVRLAPLPVLGFWILLSDEPSLWAAHLTGLVLILAGLWVTVLVNRASARALASIATLAVVTLSVTVIQRLWSPAPPMPDFRLPAATTQMQTQLSGVHGQTLAVGDLTNAPLPELWSEALMGTMWRVNPTPVQNSYLLAGFREYDQTLGLNYVGLVPPTTLPSLFTPVPDVGVPLADLIALENIQLWRHSWITSMLPAPPPGWTVSGDGTYTQVWTRSTPLPHPIGGIAFIDGAVQAHQVTTEPDQIRLRVANLSQEDGVIVFSRLAWPGYSADGLALGEPTLGFLLTLDVPAGTSSRDVTVAFVPPGLTAGTVALFLVLIVVGVADVRRTRCRARARDRDRADT